MNLLVITNQEHTIDTQKIQRMEPKYNTKENHQTTKGRDQRRKENSKKKRKKTRKN